MQSRSKNNDKKNSSRSFQIIVNNNGEYEKESLPAAGNRRIWRTGGVDFPFRWCPPGSFFMGDAVPQREKSGDSGNKKKNKSGRHNFESELLNESFYNSDSGHFQGFIDETEHEVTMTRGFWMLEIPVTQFMYETIMGVNPSKFKGRFRPVEMVNWYDAVSCVNRAGALLKLKIVLPSEAQWEYACRAGEANSDAIGDDLEEKCWYVKNSQKKTHKVGLKQPNAWGLYDMQGNVWEWCADWYGKYYNMALIDPTGSYYGDRRVCRGGCWLSEARNCRPACRSSAFPLEYDDNIGFRFLIEQYIDPQISDYDEW